ncbi:hypothetical protein RRG08_005432 [Elysia crispata]|uniref:Uncharacterized protein n=1 Tax=Elysia crispata TaxID=231223 RepID=A0AAE0Y152_9GAST|nr:hypothetical protein RRG08_005432 [Elysia crispata]
MDRLPPLGQFLMKQACDEEIVITTATIIIKVWDDENSFINLHNMSAELLMPIFSALGQDNPYILSTFPTAVTTYRHYCWGSTTLIAVCPVGVYALGGLDGPGDAASSPLNHLT